MIFLLLFKSYQKGTLFVRERGGWNEIINLTNQFGFRWIVTIAPRESEAIVKENVSMKNPCFFYWLKDFWSIFLLVSCENQCYITLEKKNICDCSTHYTWIIMFAADIIPKTIPDKQEVINGNHDNLSVILKWFAQQNTRSTERGTRCAKNRTE